MPKLGKRIFMRKTKPNLNSFCLIYLSASTLLFTACASTPDPAKICTAEWITPRVNRHMQDFEKDTRKIFANLEKTAHSYSKNGKVGPLQMFSMMNSLNALAKKVEHGRAMKDMRTLANTCDDPKLIKTAMTNFLRRKGLDEKFIQFLNNLEQYRKLLETGKKPNIKRI